MAKTVGKLDSWAALAGLGLLGFLQPLAGPACQSPAGTSATTSAQAVVVADLLADVGPEVVLPTLDRFATEMDLLATALSTLEEDLASGDGDTAQINAQDQWIVAMTVWQELELMQIGPSASSLNSVAGEDIRDEIYSWTSVNPCRVDQETVNENWNNDEFFSENLANAYGMDALEHLLFAGEESDCPAQVEPVSDGSWDALGPDGVAANRAAFAGAITQEVLRLTNSLMNEWSPDGGNFSEALTATTDDSPYESQQAALNAVFDALFYLETMTKDRKLAQPLGLMECSESTCPEDVEGLESGASLAFIEGNLNGFEILFTGGEGIGLDDLLAELGHGDVSDQMLIDIENTRTALALCNDPLSGEIIDNYDAVNDAYLALKEVTDVLKGDLATILSLQIPSEAAGDND